MPYTLHFTDPTNTATITVPDMPPGINEVDTSLSLIGKGYPNYGQKTAENFLYLLENFANALPPANAIAGQLWYDTSDKFNKILKIKPVSNVDHWSNVNGIYQQTTDPSVDPLISLKAGDIWIDTQHNQLKIYTGAVWILIGPQTANLGSGNTPTASTNGAYATNVSDNFNTVGGHDIIIDYIGGNPAAIISASSFTPNPVILGFESIKAGINIPSGTLYNGTAPSAQSLSVNGLSVQATDFLRTDIASTTNYPLSIQNNLGLLLGSDLSFSITKSSKDILLTNLASAGSVGIQVTAPSGTTTATVLTANYNSITITTSTNLIVHGESILQGVTANIVTSTSINISGNETVGGNLQIAGITTTTGLLNIGSNVIPTTNTINIGSSSSPINKIYVTSIGTQTTTIYGDVYGNLHGQLIGPLTATAISAIPVSNTSSSYMSVAAYDTSTSILSQVPYALCVPGMMMLWTYNTPPVGWIVADGTNVSRYTYPNLWDALPNRRNNTNNTIQLPQPSNVGYYWIIKY